MARRGTANLGGMGDDGVLFERATDEAHVRERADDELLGFPDDLFGAPSEDGTLGIDDSTFSVPDEPLPWQGPSLTLPNDMWGGAASPEDGTTVHLADVELDEVDFQESAHRAGPDDLQEDGGLEIEELRFVAWPEPPPDDDFVAGAVPEVGTARPTTPRPRLAPASTVGRAPARGARRWLRGALTTSQVTAGALVLIAVAALLLMVATRGTDQDGGPGLLDTTGAGQTSTVPAPTIPPAPTSSLATVPAPSTPAVETPAEPPSDSSTSTVAPRSSPVTSAVPPRATSPSPTPAPPPATTVPTTAAVPPPPAVSTTVTTPATIPPDTTPTTRRPRETAPETSLPPTTTVPSTTVPGTDDT